MPFDNFMTPPDVLEMIRDSMGGITFDPSSCEIAQHYVKSETYCTAPNCTIKAANGTPDGIRLTDGLQQTWRGNVYGNFPYSNGNMEPFVDKAVEQWKSDYAVNSHNEMVDLFGTGHKIGIRVPNIEQMIILCNSQTDTAWYHKLLQHSTAHLLWRGRIKFWKMFDGKAWEKWEGEKSKQEGKGKVSNQPRYLNTLFLFSRTPEQTTRFIEVFRDKGTVCRTW